MYSPQEVYETFEMLSLQHLDVRTVTLGINLLDCIDQNFDNMVEKVSSKIINVAGSLLTVAKEIELKYGVKIVNKRLAVTPLAILLEPHSIGANADAENLGVKLAESLDRVASKIGVDFIGGYSAFVQKGWTPGDIALINSIPKALSSTSRICSCVNIAGTKSGINVDAAVKMGEIVKETARLTSDKKGVGCAKLVTFTNAPEDNPFMPGAFHGLGEAETSVNIGISGPGVIRAIVEKNDDLDLRDLADLIKRAAFKVTRVGELLGREVAQRLGIKFSTVDLSLAPTPQEGDSIARIIEAMGIERCGAPGTTAALALLTDAIKKGGSMGTSFVGGLSGAFIPVSEDAGMSEAVEKGALSLEKLEAMTAICAAGLDMIAIPGDTSAETISAIILDQAAICIINNKPGGVRLLPIPGLKAGDYVEFGGLLGRSMVMPVNKFSASKFLKRGGQIPSTLNSLRG